MNDASQETVCSRRIFSSARVKPRIIPILWKCDTFYAIALGNTFIGWILTPDSGTRDCTGTNVALFLKHKMLFDAT